jgi:PST family polysaccharide transporter
VVFILLDASLVAFAILVVVEMTMAAVGLIYFYRRQGPVFSEWTASVRELSEMLRRSWPLILSGFGAIVYLKVDQIMLGDLASERAVGIYAVAAQLSEVWYFFPAAIVSSVFPALLEQKADNKQAYKIRMQQLYDGLALSAFALAIPTTFLADFVIDFVYGAEFAGAGTILAVHIWACAFIFMRKALSKWIIAEDLYIFSIITHGAGAVTNIALNFYLIPSFEGLGAAVATVISYATASYFALFLHRRTWEAARMMTLALLSPIRLPYKYFVGSS